MDNSFVKTPEEVCSFFNVDINHGLKTKQVEELRSKYGKNGKRHT
jgi:Ca2+ transporting ATPase